MSGRKAQSGHRGLVLQSCGRRKDFGGKQRVSASVSCPVGAGVPPKPAQVEAVRVCAGVEKVCVSVDVCVCLCMCVRARACVRKLGCQSLTLDVGE